MELSIALDLGGWLLLVTGALIFGVLAQSIGKAKVGYEWLGDAIAAGIGALVASEFIVAWRTFEPVWGGLAIVPALIGGLVAGLIVELGTRYVTHGSYMHQPVAA